jgi:GNAT superfamily N-acetyltransferase
MQTAATGYFTPYLDKGKKVVVDYLTSTYKGTEEEHRIWQYLPEILFMEGLEAFGRHDGTIMAILVSRTERAMDYFPSPRLHIGVLDVAPKDRKESIGARLLRMLVTEQSKPPRLTSAWTHLTCTPTEESLGFWTKFGFKPIDPEDLEKGYIAECAEVWKLTERYEKRVPAVDPATL